MIAVANASVLIGLSAIDRLALLLARFPGGSRPGHMPSAAPRGFVGKRRGIPDGFACFGRS